MSVLHIHSSDFQSVVMESQKTVLLDFWAAWCAPCRMIAPFLEEIAEERADVKVCKVDVDEAPEVAAKFGVASIPTLLVIKNGTVVNKSVGAVPKAKILEML